MAGRLDLALYRNLLEEERARVLKEINDIQALDRGASESEESGELADYDEHQGDQGTETFLRERDEALEANAETILRQVEVALRKIDEGTYGICERCGEPIPPARLKAIPYTPYCIKDAERIGGAA